MNLSTGYGYTYNHYGTGTNRSRGTLGLNAGGIGRLHALRRNRRRRQRNARIDVENAELTRQQLELSLRADLSNFWQAYRNNLEVILLEEDNLVAARENYEIAMERYRLGDLPGIEMREAQKSLLDAEERILTAQYNTKALRNIPPADQRQRIDLFGIGPPETLRTPRKTRRTPRKPVREAHRATSDTRNPPEPPKTCREAHRSHFGNLWEARRKTRRPFGKPFGGSNFSQKVPSAEGTFPYSSKYFPAEICFIGK